MKLSCLYGNVYFFLSILSVFSTYPFGCCRDTYKKLKLQENLWWEIHEKRLGKIKQALNKGADPNEAGVMRLAIESNNSKIVALLIASGATVCDEHCIYAENLGTEFLYYDRLRPFLHPIKNNKIIQLLKKHRQKRDPSIRSYIKDSIVYAQYCWLNTSEKNQLLRDLFKNLLHNPEPNTIVNIKLLLEAGANPIDKHNCLYTYTPSSLKLVILTNNTEIISLVLSYVPKQDEIHAQEIMSKMLTLPAHLKTATYELLLQKGANPDEWDRFSKVIEYEHETEKTQLLLRYGADIYAKRALIKFTEMTFYSESPLKKAIREAAQNKKWTQNSHLELLISSIFRKCFFTPPEKSEQTTLLLCLKRLSKNSPVHLHAYTVFAQIFKLENNRRKEKVQDPQKIRNLLPELDLLKDQTLRERLQNKLKKLIDEKNKKKPTN